MISTQPDRILVSDHLDRLLHEVAKIRIAKRKEIYRKIIEALCKKFPQETPENISSRFAIEISACVREIQENYDGDPAVVVGQFLLPRS